MISTLLLGCTSIPEPCNPGKRASVFESNKLKVSKTIDLENIEKVIFHSYRKPSINDTSAKTQVWIEGVENVSVSGYHTDECTAERTINGIRNAKPSITYKVVKKDNILTIKTIGEWRFIHHSSALSEIKINLPKQIKFEYIHEPLKRR